MKDFEDFLREKHGEIYTGTDDNMIDDYEEWLSDLDIEAWVTMGNWYGNIKFQEALEKCEQIIK